MDKNNPYSLGYYHAESGNVGDDLNAWLWPRLFGEQCFSADSKKVLIGIGSVLDTRFDHYHAKLVFGAGVRGVDSIPRLDESWEICFVRGPLSRQALAPQREVEFITDPAILVADFFKRDPPPDERVGLIPYFKSNENLWRRVAERCGYTFISPRASVEQFVSELSKCSRIFTESMHGAIIADSLRIPWQPITSLTLFEENQTHLFKWSDWCGSMNLDFSELLLPVVWAESDEKSIKLKLKAAYISMRLKRQRKSQFFLSDTDHFRERLALVKEQIAKTKLGYA